ncbi:MAG: ferritin-like domain-containing protein [Janthinobacterium lividum]
MTDQQPNLARRRLIQSTGASAVAVTALAAAGVAAVSSPAEAQGVNDAAVLNFALNLEYLEAEFYIRAATGVGLTMADTSGTGYAGSVIGGSKVPFTTPAIQQYATEIANDELNHVRFIRSALNTNAVGQPAIDLSNSFVALGNLIGVPNFNPFADEVSFLIGSYIFEDVGVTAYHGAAALISNKQILTAAAGILAVEAYHAAEIRTLLFQAGAGSTTVKISNVRASLSGPNDDQGVINSNGTANIVPTDANSLAFSRSPRQVLNIVYGAPNATKGLFFPNGMNGAIK